MVIAKLQYSSTLYLTLASLQSPTARHKKNASEYDAPGGGSKGKGAGNRAAFAWLNDGLRTVTVWEQ